ncbi:RNA polymerase sigma factor [Singulisphaera rosea]
MMHDRRETPTRYLRTLFGVGRVAARSDGELLEHFRSDAGDASELAFNSLVERHGPMVLNTCRRVLRDSHEAEDAFQATFLILVFKKRSVWIEDSLGPWLHRVAYRVATHAKIAADRRRKGQTGTIEIPVESDDIEARAELEAILHEEIDRLPDRYRRPVVLCDLEGFSYDEAARLLARPIGTVKSRLNRARERLRIRLTRRGITPTFAVTGSLASSEIVSAAIPVAVRSSLVRAASRLATGRTMTAGITSPSVLNLVKGTVRTMSHSKVLGAGGLLLAVGMVTVGFGQLPKREANQPGDTAQETSAATDGKPVEAPRVPKGETPELAAEERQRIADSRAKAEIEELEYEADKETLRSLLKEKGHLMLKSHANQLTKEEAIQYKRMKTIADFFGRELWEKGRHVHLSKLERLEEGNRRAPRAR